MKLVFQMNAGLDEVFASDAFVNSIGNDVGIGVITKAKVAKDGKTADITLKLHGEQALLEGAFLEQISGFGLDDVEYQELVDEILDPFGED